MVGMFRIKSSFTNTMPMPSWTNRSQWTTKFHWNGLWSHCFHIWHTANSLRRSNHNIFTATFRPANATNSGNFIEIRLKFIMQLGCFFFFFYIISHRASHFSLLIFIIKMYHIFHRLMSRTYILLMHQANTCDKIGRDEREFERIFIYRTQFVINCSPLLKASLVHLPQQIICNSHNNVIWLGEIS